jgi:hypothetical protein
MTAFTRSVAGDQPDLTSIAYQTNRMYAQAGVFYQGVSPGVLIASKAVQKTLTGSEPAPTGTLTRNILIKISLTGNQPASSGSLFAVWTPGPPPDPQEVVYIDGPYVAQAQYTSSVRP